MTETSVLIVEDETGIAMDLEAQLQHLGYRVAGIASSGEEALTLTESLMPDVVLMNIRLRGSMDGIEVAKSIGRLRVPFLYVTSHTDEETLQKARLTEPLGFLVKPFSARDLHGAIQVALYRSSAERRVREHENWLRTTLRSIGDAVVATSPEGHIKFMNPVAEQLTGWSEIAALGERIENVVCLEMEDAKTCRNPLLQALTESRSIHIEEGAQLIARDGARIYIDDSATPIKEDDGKLAGGVMVFRDVTERRKLEQERARAMQSLRRANHDLEQFAYAAGHDLQEPLRNVSSYLQLLSRLHSDQLGPDARSLISEAVGSANRMRSLIDDLLKYASETAHSDEPPPVFSTQDALEIALTNLRISIQETRAIVNYGSLPRIAAPLHQIISLFQNLVGNALKYRNPNHPSVIEISAERQADEWQFSVSDNGIGFDDKFTDSIFGLFKRLHGSEYTGTGVGLAVCKRIVETQGGRIWAQSQLGKGTTFYFTFPIIPELTEDQLDSTYAKSGSSNGNARAKSTSS